MREMGESEKVKMRGDRKWRERERGEIAMGM